MNWKSADGNSRNLVLTNQRGDENVDVVAQIERLPDGSWKWTLCETATRPATSGVERTLIHAERAVERIVAPPERLPSVEHIFVGTEEIENLNTPKELRPLFAARDIDEETWIEAARYSKVKGIPVLEESWYWDGFTGSSLILPKKYLVSLEESDVVTMLRQHFDIPAGYTYSSRITSQFVYVNYGFVSVD